MKVCVISTPVFAVPVAGYSGLEHIAWLQARGLAGRGHQVAMVAPHGSTCPGVEMIPCGPAGHWNEEAAYGGHQPSGYGGYWQHLPNFDVIIDHTWNKFSYLLKSEGKLPAPILGVTHAPIDTMYRVLPPGVDRPCFVCISKDQAAHFEALHGREARTCYNGVDPEFYKPIGLPRSGRFLFLARFSSIKGADLAIEACVRTGAGLDLVGDTTITQEPDFFRACASRCDGKQIRMIGNAPRGECVHWFSQAHTLLHPNQRFREPFGLAPVESMLCGCPVIAWKYGAVRETVPVEGGSLVSSLDELTEAVKVYGKANLEPLRVSAREQAMRFSVDAMVSRMEELCREAVSTGGW